MILQYGMYDTQNQNADKELIIHGMLMDAQIWKIKNFLNRTVQHGKFNQTDLN